MATNANDPDQAEECRMAIEAAMGVAMDHCVDEEEVTAGIGRILGVEPDINCELALREGLDEQTCGNLLGVRQWVMCKTHDILQNDDVTFSQAIEQAWGEAGDVCGDLGIEV